MGSRYLIDVIALGLVARRELPHFFPVGVERTCNTSALRPLVCAWVETTSFTIESCQQEMRGSDLIWRESASRGFEERMGWCGHKLKL